MYETISFLKEWDRHFSGDYQVDDSIIECTSNNVVIEIPVCGFELDEVSVTFEDGKLRINAKHDDKELSGYKKMNDDIDYCYRLSDELNPSKVEATLKNGLLSLTIPRKESAKPKKIKIK